MSGGTDNVNYMRCNFPFQDGTIGHDLVVKPAPASVRNFLEMPPYPGGAYPDAAGAQFPSGAGRDDIHAEDRYGHRASGPEEEEEEEEEEELPIDYAFLDEEDREDTVVYRPKRGAAERCEGCVSTGYHIVYRRRDGSAHHTSDYGKQLSRHNSVVCVCVCVCVARQDRWKMGRRLG